MTGQQTVDALLAGSTAVELQPEVSQLPIMELHALLCSACWMRNDIASNCAAYADEVDKLLTRNCGIYAAGVRGCLLGFAYRPEARCRQLQDGAPRAINNATV